VDEVDEEVPIGDVDPAWIRRIDGDAAVVEELSSKVLEGLGHRHRVAPRLAAVRGARQGDGGGHEAAVRRVSEVLRIEEMPGVRAGQGRLAEQEVGGAQTWRHRPQITERFTAVVGDGHAAEAHAAVAAEDRGESAARVVEAHYDA